MMLGLTFTVTEALRLNDSPGRLSVEVRINSAILLTKKNSRSYASADSLAKRLVRLEECDLAKRLVRLEERDGYASF
jgi:hypothetical protein